MGKKQTQKRKPARRNGRSEEIVTRAVRGEIPARATVTPAPGAALYSATLPYAANACCACNPPTEPKPKPGVPGTTNG
jgi:hypothetical protein